MKRYEMLWCRFKMVTGAFGNRHLLVSDQEKNDKQDKRNQYLKRQNQLQQYTLYNKSSTCFNEHNQRMCAYRWTQFEGEIFP